MQSSFYAIPHYFFSVYYRLPKCIRFIFCCFIGSLIVLSLLSIIALTGAGRTILDNVAGSHLTWRDLIFGIGTVVSGVIGNVTADNYLKWRSKKLPTPRIFFGNHDLTKLVGQSLGMILRSTAERIPQKSDASRIIALAMRLENTWSDIVNSEWGNHWLAGIKDDQLVNYISNPLKSALTVEQVDKLLQKINPEAEGTNAVDLRLVRLRNLSTI